MRLYGSNLVYGMHTRGCFESYLTPAFQALQRVDQLRLTVEIAVALGSVWRSAKTSEHQSNTNFNTQQLNQYGPNRADSWSDGSAR
jgi:hypothetical protein